MELGKTFINFAKALTIFLFHLCLEGEKSRIPSSFINLASNPLAFAGP
jgi:hypothetical protein